MEQIENERRTRQLGHVVGVRLAVGEFAGIEPMLLQSAFQEATLAHWRRDVQLECEVVPLRARCRQCSVEFAVKRFRFLCPDCHSSDVDVISGEELQLVSLIIDQEHPSGAAV